MNRLDKNALTMARQYKEQLPYVGEKEFIECCTMETIVCGNRKIPYIQRQAFAERAHYYWLCLTRGLPCN